MRIFLLLVCFFILNNTFAQYNLPKNPTDKGKEVQSIPKDLMKKAESGEQESIGSVAAIWQGHCLGNPNQKNYAKAVSFLDKMASENSIGVKADWRRFVLHLVGGYGMKKTDFGKANQIHTQRNGFEELTPEKTTYKKDILPKQFFTLLSKAYDKQNPDSLRDKVLLARYFLELDISEPIARELLVRVRNQNPDADFLLEKYWALKSQYAQNQAVDFTKDYKALSIPDLERWALAGSPMASMEWVWANIKAGGSPEKSFIEKSEKYLEKTLNGKDKELKFKAFYLLQNVQRGRERLATLRKWSALKAETNLEYTFAKKDLEEWESIVPQLENLNGLGKMLEANAISEIPLRNFLQNPKQYAPVFALYLALKEPINANFIGEENLLKYQKELQKHLQKTVNQADTIKTVLQFWQWATRSEHAVLASPSFLKEMQNVSFGRLETLIGQTSHLETLMEDFTEINLLKPTEWLDNQKIMTLKGEIIQRIRLVVAQSNSVQDLVRLKAKIEKNALLSAQYPEFGADYEKRLKEIKAKREEIAFYEYQLRLENMSFTDMSIARIYQAELSSDSRLTPSFRNQLLGTVRRKALLGTYGKTPTVLKIKELERLLMFETWLKPEGYDMLFEYKSDNPYWFSGDIMMGAHKYHYEVIKEEESGKYELDIRYADKSSSAFLYRHLIEINAQGDQFAVRIPCYKYDGYREKPDGHLAAIYKRSSYEVEYQAVGGMQGKRTSEGSTQKLSNEFSEKAAARTAVEYLIKNYKNALKAH